MVEWLPKGSTAYLRPRSDICFCNWELPSASWESHTRCFAVEKAVIEPWCRGSRRGALDDMQMDRRMREWLELHRI